MNRVTKSVLAVVALLALTLGLIPGAVADDSGPGDSAGSTTTTGAAQTRAAAGPGGFATYTGKKPLKKIPRGTVLKHRTVAYHIQGLPLPLRAIQLVYRTEDARKRAVTNVTTVVRPVLPIGRTPKVLAYQSFYDSLNPADQPSNAIAGGVGLGRAIANIETLLFAPALLAGFTVVVADTQGQQADFAAGPEYGATTLDSLKAVSRWKAAGVGSRAKIGLIGYSGGAIASEWAAEMAPRYAPAIAKRLVGTAIGGVLVSPGHNLHYVEGSRVWAGVLPMALAGIARGYGIDLKPYLNAYGAKVIRSMQKVSITSVLGAYPGLTWKQIAKRKYAVPETVKPYVRVANKLIMGRYGTPSAPLFVGQGTGGELEGSVGTKPGIGKGDGVMIAGDVRTLARQYCSRGVRVQYRQYPLSHFTSVAPWLPEAYAWLVARFAGVRAPSSCGSIAAGNSLAPIRLKR